LLDGLDQPFYLSIIRQWRAGKAKAGALRNEELSEVAGEFARGGNDRVGLIGMTVRTLCALRPNGKGSAESVTRTASASKRQVRDFSMGEIDGRARNAGRHA
jgi:hypothetical protein